MNISILVRVIANQVRQDSERTYVIRATRKISEFRVNS